MRDWGEGMKKVIWLVLGLVRSVSLIVYAASLKNWLAVIGWSCVLLGDVRDIAAHAAGME